MVDGFHLQKKDIYVSNVLPPYDHTPEVRGVLEAKSIAQRTKGGSTEFVTTCDMLFFGTHPLDLSRVFGNICFGFGVTVTAPARPAHPKSDVAHLADAPQDT